MIFYFIFSSPFEFGNNRVGMEYRNSSSVFNKILISILKIVSSSNEEVLNRINFEIDRRFVKERIFL